jgi:hypothetical protein
MSSSVTFWPSPRSSSCSRGSGSRRVSPEHLTIGLMFLIVSLLRSYLLRRLFERHRALR